MTKMKSVRLYKTQPNKSLALEVLPEETDIDRADLKNSDVSADIVSGSGPVRIQVLSREFSAGLRISECCKTP